MTTQGKFGTSEDFVFTPQGKLEIKEFTNEICKACEDSAGGPCYFGVRYESPTSVAMICTNCGEQKTVHPKDVMRRGKKE